MRGSATPICTLSAIKQKSSYSGFPIAGLRCSRRAGSGDGPTQFLDPLARERHVWGAGNIKRTLGPVHATRSPDPEHVFELKRWWRLVGRVRCLNPSYISLSRPQKVFHFRFNTPFIRHRSFPLRSIDRITHSDRYSATLVTGLVPSTQWPPPNLWKFSTPTICLTLTTMSAWTMFSRMHDTDLLLLAASVRPARNRQHARLSKAAKTAAPLRNRRHGCADFL